MGKLVPVLLSGTGAAVVSTGGMYVLNGAFFSEEEIFSRELSFKSLDDFKKVQREDCSKKYFPNLSYDNLTGLINASNGIVSSDLQKSSSAEENLKSCLIVNWERNDSQETNPSNKKWTGNFRWLWSFVNGDKGFVVFSTTKLSSTTNQFDLEGGIYFVSKEGNGSNKTWKIKKYKEENGTSKSINQTNFSSAFPQPADNFDGLSEEHKTNWGFVSGANDLTSLCKKDEADCPKTPVTKKPDFKEVWEWQVSSGNESVTPDKWSKSFNGNLTNLFGTEGFSMSNVFDTFKGSWKKVSVKK